MLSPLRSLINLGCAMDIIIHGFNVRNPDKTVGRLRAFLDPYFMFEYGWFGLLSVMLYNKREAKKLKGLIDAYIAKGEDVTIYAHSNGCAISVLAASMGANIKNLVCINPALKVKTDFPESIGKVVVVHTKHDTPTRAARFFDNIPFIGLLIPNAWGAMGAKGSSATDKRVHNLDLSDSLNGHSDFFRMDKLQRFMPKIKQLL